MWIKLRVSNNGQVSENYIQVYGYDGGCGYRKGVFEPLAEMQGVDNDEQVLEVFPNQV